MVNRSLSKDEPVVAAKCAEYDEKAILRALHSADETLGITSLRGKKVVVKPNFVAKCAPDKAATVHPAVLGAVADWLRDHGADNVMLAESPGGIYNYARLRGIYSATGASEIAENHAIELNYDCSFDEVSAPNGKVCRLFDIIKPILDADVIVDLCKLKTHALTGMSAAVKNMFGSIPGIVKFEMHSRYPDYGDFAEMLVDLCELLCSRTEFISITDAIVGMEGNGPTAGEPRPIGALLISRNPFASDVVAAGLIGRDGDFETVARGERRGFSMADCASMEAGTKNSGKSPLIVETCGASIKNLTVRDFVRPDSADKNAIEIMRNLFGGRIYKLFAPYPTVEYASCLGCGECAASCPQHTIKMMERDDASKNVRSASRAKVKKVPVIERAGCIRCFCCQELCPHGVVKIRKNPITRILS